VSDSRDVRPAEGLLRLLETERPLDELRVTLATIREFKELESRDEWMMRFIAWVRLEQLEDYLRLLTNDGADEVSDEVARAYFAAMRR
jgi:hypothetical protein